MCTNVQNTILELQLMHHNLLINRVLLITLGTLLQRSSIRRSEKQDISLFGNRANQIGTKQT